MKKFMVIHIVDGEQGANFFDTVYQAEDFRFTVECGMGGLAEVYEYDEEEHEYKFLFC